MLYCCHHTLLLRDVTQILHNDSVCSVALFPSSLPPPSLSIFMISFTGFKFHHGDKILSKDSFSVVFFEL